MPIILKYLICLTLANIDLLILTSFLSSLDRTAPQIKREFEIDFNSIEEGEDVITGSIPKLRSIDINDVTEAASIPQNLLKAYGNGPKSTSRSSISASVKDVATLLDLTIAKISSADINVAMESLMQLEDVFKKQKTEDEILKRVDQVILPSTNFH